MTVTLRGEQLADYPAIADVHIRAFGNRSGESLLVGVHRLRPEFDPELSVVATDAGQVVGHALFTPRRLIFGGEVVPAAQVSPVGVRPEWQRSGVGGAIMRYGLELARAKGYQMSFLLGHASYYPRFGYNTNAYGHSHLFLRPADLPNAVGEVVDGRGVREEDIPGLQALRAYCEAGVDFSVLPGDRLSDWLSTSPVVQTTVFLRAGEVVGYARYEPGKGDRISCFLARDRETAIAVLRGIAAPSRKARMEPNTAVRIPLHPAARATRELFAGIPYEGVLDAPASAMAVELALGAFSRYLSRLRAGEIPPGRITWPVEFELLD